MARLRKTTREEAGQLLNFCLLLIAAGLMFGAYLLLWEPPDPSVRGHHGPHDPSRFKKYSKFSAHKVCAPPNRTGLSADCTVCLQPLANFAGVLDTGYGPVKIADTVIHRSTLLDEPAVPIGCSAPDADDNCKAWAESRECEKNMLYMEQVCPCSCALRAQSTPPPGFPAAATALPPAPTALAAEQPGVPTPMHQYNVGPAPKDS